MLEAVNDVLASDDVESIEKINGAMKLLGDDSIGRFVSVELIGAFVDDDTLSNIAFWDAWESELAYALTGITPTREEIVKAIHSVPDKLIEKFAMTNETAELVTIIAAYVLFGTDDTTE